MSKTKIRHPSLSSTSARGILGHRQDQLEFASLFRTIDQLADMHDGLVAVREAPDPLKSREAQAVEYREAHRRASEKADGIIRSSMERLLDYHNRTLRDAEGKAGIAHPPAEAAEIRAALRGMSQEDRQKAISDAMKNGDSAVVASIRNISPLLVGKTLQPLDEMAFMYVQQRVPEITQDLADVEEALRNLEFATVAFRKSAEEMRDPKAEQVADDGMQKAKLADAQLGLAVQDRPDTLFV